MILSRQQYNEHVENLLRVLHTGPQAVRMASEASQYPKDHVAALRELQARGVVGIDALPEAEYTPEHLDLLCRVAEANEEPGTMLFMAEGPVQFDFNEEPQ